MPPIHVVFYLKGQNMSKAKLDKHHKECPYCHTVLGNAAKVCTNKECGKPFPLKDKKAKATPVHSSIPSIGDTAIMACKVGSVDNLVKELGKLSANDVMAFAIQCGGIDKAKALANELKDQTEKKPAKAPA